MNTITTKVVGAGSSRKRDDIHRTPDIYLKDDDGEIGRQLKKAIEQGELVFVRKKPTPNEKPIRVQLSRKKGWRMPPGTVKVDRSTKWGNPFIIAKARQAGCRGDDKELAAYCVEAFRKWLGAEWRMWWSGGEAERQLILDSLPYLRGKNLACWCKPGEPCHADVLIELANA